MKIAITGTDSTGKTTLATEVSKRYGIPMIPEYAREVAAELNLKKPRDMSPDQALAFQKRILQRKMDEEAKHSSFIADRSTADNLAYYLRWCSRGIDDDISESYVGLCAESMKRYDRVIFLPWNAIPLEHDGFRSSKRYHQYEIHCMLLGILADHKVPYEILDEKDLEKRVRYFSKFFNGGINE